MIPVVTMIEQVVDATRTANIIAAGASVTLLSYLQRADNTIETIGYMYGHKAEINQRLQDMELNPALRRQKFPCIILVEDFPVDTPTTGLPTTTLNILICHSTGNDLKSYQRQTQIFDPILYPVMNEFLNQLCKSQYFAQVHPHKISRRQIDRKRLGKESTNGNTEHTFDMYVDAVQLQNLQLILNKPYCTTNKWI